MRPRRRRIFAALVGRRADPLRRECALSHRGVLRGDLSVVDRAPVAPSPAAAYRVLLSPLRIALSAAVSVQRADQHRRALKWEGMERNRLSGDRLFRHRRRTLALCDATAAGLDRGDLLVPATAVGERAGALVTLRNVDRACLPGWCHDLGRGVSVVQNTGACRRSPCQAKRNKRRSHSMGAGSSAFTATIGSCSILATMAWVQRSNACAMATS